MVNSKKQFQRVRRHRRVRAKIYGTAGCPRFCVFRSNKYIYAQLIDDERGRTLVAARVQEILFKSDSKRQKLTKTAAAFEMGKALGQKAVKKNIERVVFDRGGYKYHGRVKAVADGAKEGGLKF